MIRSKKYLQSARGQDCTIQIPGVCNHDSSTVVAAHSNRQKHGKGMGQKSHDIFVAWSCSNCHSAIDGHLNTTYSAVDLYDFWVRGFERTLVKAIEEGLITL